MREHQEKQEGTCAKRLEEPQATTTETADSVTYRGNSGDVHTEYLLASYLISI